MGISFGGINTGLPPNLVEQLIEVEKLPIKAIEQKKEKTEVKMNLVNDIETKMVKARDSIKELAGTRGFTDIRLLSGDPNIVQGVVDPSIAQPGNWNVEVIQLAQKAAAVTNGFPDRDRTEIGVGYFSFKTSNGDKEVYINGENNTLDGVVKAINNAKVGVRATIINDRKNPDEPFKLVISGESVGGENQIEYPTLYFLDGDQDIYFDENREAKNGIVKVDGFEMEIADNTLKDIIPGVTLELKQESPGRSVNVSVKNDMEAISGKISEFVKSMNEVFAFIQNQNRMTEKTDTSQTLGGDSLIRTVEQRLRRLVQSQQMGVKTPIKSLNQLGIVFNRSGTLDFDEEKFNAVLAQNPEAVQMFFSGDGLSTGFIPNLRREFDGLLNGAFGQIANRKRGLQQKLNQFNGQIENKERQLQRKEVQLREKFSKLEQTMSKLKSQGAAVAGMGGGGMGGMNLGGASM